MSAALELRTILLGRGSAQATVLEVRDGTALVSTAAGSKRVAMDIAVAVGDQVTVREGRIVSKRTGGAGGSLKVYHV